MKPEKIQIKIQEELLLAKQSRLEGNEGRARVCARRAAGAAVLDYLIKQGKLINPENTYQTLVIFRSIKGLPDRVEQALDRLIQRVDHEYQLPPGVDLIKEANILINFIKMGEMEN